MCGPLVLALPGRSGHWRAHVFYHLGRISTYTALGAIIGGLGAALSTAAGSAGGGLLWVVRAQVALSLVAATVLLHLGLARLGVVAEPAWMRLASPSLIPGFRRVKLGSLSARGPSAMLLVGMLLGLLPCGLSYAAFARALPAGGAGPGAMLVAAFGVGTVPGLFLVGTVASQVARRHARMFDLLSGVLLIGMAAVLAADALGALL
jgi:sulfite exporter TauE/SafE